MGSPAQGDVRLVPLTSITSDTAPCDVVHFGSVEIFNDGRWGRICGGDNEDFTLGAQVVCRQLGFPFGSLYDATEVYDSNGNTIGTDYEDYSEPGEIVFATEVVCTGKEARLDECFFPEAFGAAPRVSREEDQAVEAGIRQGRCARNDGSARGVVCRQFEIEGVVWVQCLWEPPWCLVLVLGCHRSKVPRFRIDATRLCSLQADLCI